MTNGRSIEASTAGTQSSRSADNRTVIIEFLVDDVDGVHQNLAGFVEDFVQEPTTMPWGNRSLLFRDPDDRDLALFPGHPGWAADAWVAIQLCG